MKEKAINEGKVTYFVNTRLFPKLPLEVRLPKLVKLATTGARVHTHTHTHTHTHVYNLGLYVLSLNFGQCGHLAFDFLGILQSLYHVYKRDRKLSPERTVSMVIISLDFRVFLSDFHLYEYDKFTRGKIGRIR
jgi:hypothetical protein